MGELDELSQNRKFICECMQSMINGLAASSTSEYSHLILILLTVKAAIIGKDEAAFAEVCHRFAVEQIDKIEDEITNNSPEYLDWLNNAGKEE